MLNKEEFIDLIEKTNIDKDTTTTEKIWIMRGCNLTWIFYNILEREENKELKITDMCEKYKELFLLVEKYKNPKDTKEKELIETYLRKLPAFKIGLELDNVTKNMYGYIWLQTKIITKKIIPELEKIKFYKELNNNIANNSKIVKEKYKI